MKDEVGAGWVLGWYLERNGDSGVTEMGEHMGNEELHRKSGECKHKAATTPGEDKGCR